MATGLEDKKQDKQANINEQENNKQMNNKVNEQNSRISLTSEKNETIETIRSKKMKLYWDHLNKQHEVQNTETMEI